MKRLLLMVLSIFGIAGLIAEISFESEKDEKFTQHESADSLLKSLEDAGKLKSVETAGSPDSENWPPRTVK